MAKKTLNPADSFRKAQRKKELKKNKAERSKARDFALVKKDTWDLQDEIERLELAKNPDEQSRLAELKAELEKINRKKAEYVKEHPEHRRLVYRPRKEVDRSQVLGDEGDDDDIVMPAGPPPRGSHDEDYDVDDIPMPDDSPLAPNSTHLPFPPLPSGHPPSGPTASDSIVTPPLPPGFPPNATSGLFLPPFPPTLVSNAAGASFLPPPPPPPPPPPGFPPYNVPFQHSNVSLGSFPQPAFPPAYAIPPMPVGFSTQYNYLSNPQQSPQDNAEHRPASLAHPSLPAKPNQETASIHALPPTLPANPTVAQSSAALGTTKATISAAPQLRDFKKEATEFVPTTVRRKKPNTSASSSRINAAPGMEDDLNEEPARPARPDLLNTLKDQLGPVPAMAVLPVAKPKKVDKKQDDYDKFMEDMKDILSTAQ